MGMMDYGCITDWSAAFSPVLSFLISSTFSASASVTSGLGLGELEGGGGKAYSGQELLKDRGARYQ